MTWLSLRKSNSVVPMPIDIAASATGDDREDDRGGEGRGDSSNLPLHMRSVNLGRAFKVISFLSPDLWFATLNAFWIRAMERSCLLASKSAESGRTFLLYVC